MAAPRVHDVYFRSPVEIEAALENQVSKGGWFVVCDDPDPRGNPVLLRFHLPGLPAPLEVPGEVAFAAPKSSPVPGLGHGMAIQFQKLSPQTLKAFSAAATIARSETGPAAAGKPVPEKPAAPAPAPKPAGMPIGKINVVRNGAAANGSVTPSAEPAPAPEPSAVEESSISESEEWNEEPGENWPEGSDEPGPPPADDEDLLEDTGPAEGPVEEPDEAQQRKILARLNTQSTENLYGTLRSMPFHQKVVAAKRGNRSVRAILIQEGNQKILNFLLQNPQISVPEIMTILKLPTVSYDVIQTISKNQAWVSSEEIRFLLVTHPKTPLPLSLNILPALNINSLAKLAKSGAIKAQLKSNALKLLEQRRKSG